MITAVFPEGSTAAGLATVVGVAAGGRLRFGNPGAKAGTLSWAPGTNRPPRGSSIADSSISIGCADAYYMPTSMRPVPVYCTPTDALAIALDSTQARPAGYSFLTDIATLDSALEFPAFRTDFASRTIQWTNAPNPGDNNRPIGGILTLVRKGESFLIPASASSTQSSGQFDFLEPPGFGEAVEVTFFTYSLIDRAHSELTKRSATSPPTVDLRAEMLPLMAPGALDISTSTTVTWLGDSLKADSDFVAVRFTATDLVRGATWKWDVISPPATASFTMPELPAGVLSFTGARIDIADVEYVDLSDAAGYHAMLEKYWVLDPRGFPAEDAARGPRYVKAAGGPADVVRRSGTRILRR